MTPTKTALARALGISASMVHRLINQGMPASSAEAAQAWRSHHLNPLKMKPPPSPPSAQFQAAQALADHAGELLAAHGDVSTLMLAIRQALAAVPEHERADVGMSRELWDVLVGRVLQLVRTEDAKDVIELTNPAEAESMGTFWFRVAAGEVVTAA